MATVLKRTGTTKYCGVLVSRAQPSGWNAPSLLLRFVEENNASTVFIMTDKALDQFRACELWRAYEFSVKGSTVKKSSGQNKFGVACTYEVAMKYAAADFQLAGRSWPFRYSYSFVDWDALNQLAANTFIDLIGAVDAKPVVDANSAIPKTILRLSNGNMTQDVEILGDSAVAAFKKGDVVTFSGLKIREWSGRRCLQTALLTFSEQNPDGRTVEAHSEGPKRKALRMSPATRFTVAQAQQETSKMLAAAQNRQPFSPMSFSIVGSVTVLGGAFFDDDVPLIQKGDAEIMCWKTSVTDQTGNIPVKIWDKPCYDLFGVTANRLRELWEEGVDNPDQQERILTDLNANMAQDVECLCRADIWRYGRDNSSCAVEVNVNEADVDA